MKRFTFPLETARQWRNRQAEIQEMRLQQLVAEKQNIEDRRVALDEELDRERRRIGDGAIDVQRLASLDRYATFVTREQHRLAAARADCERRIEAQRAVLMEARRAFQLIERLKEKALIEWQAAGAKEQEELAAELFLARRAREES
jgi:hypothetical protein